LSFVRIFPIQSKKKGKAMAASPKKGAALVAVPVAEPVSDSVTHPTEAATEVAETIVEADAGMLESTRAAFEKGFAESRAVFVEAKVSADEAVNALEQSFTAAKDGVIAINAKALAALRANADANFEFMKASFAVKSLSDLVALQGEFTRKQVDAVTGQAKDIGALTQKTMAEAIEPLKDQMAKTFRLTP
jgi:phasin family protein